MILSMHVYLRILACDLHASMHIHGMMGREEVELTVVVASSRLITGFLQKIRISFRIQLRFFSLCRT
jgi:hypothetical protein